MPLSSAEYVKRKGIICPYCECSDVEEIGQTAFIEISLYQEVKCTKCGKCWTDVYELTGYEEMAIDHSF